MKWQSRPSDKYRIRFDQAKISKIVNREYDVVVDVQAEEGSLHTLVFEHTVRALRATGCFEWEPGKELSPRLVGSVVEEIVVRDSGLIQVVLEDGKFEGYPDDRYESWSMITPEKQFFCLAGGECSIFSKLRGYVGGEAR